MKIDPLTEKKEVLSILNTLHKAKIDDILSCLNTLEEQQYINNQCIDELYLLLTRKRTRRLDQ